ncbi:unnamed protein product, partial [Gulo gulo]
MRHHQLRLVTEEEPVTSTPTYFVKVNKWLVFILLDFNVPSLNYICIEALHF